MNVVLTFPVVISLAPILSNAGCGEAAANTARLVWGVLLVAPAELPPHAAIRPTASNTTSRLVTRQLHADVGRLHDRDGRHPGLELQLIDRLSGEERDQAVRSGLDLDLRGDSVLDHARDDAGKPVARRLRDEDLGFGSPTWFGQACKGCAVDQPLSTRASCCGQPAVVDHAPHRVWADPEHLGGLTQPIVRHWP